MKNASKAVRDAYYNALDGQITYNSASVPVYKTSPVEKTPDHFIVLGAIDEVNDPNDAKFIREVSIVVDVITTHYRYRTTDTVDAISEDITQIILSSIGGSLTDTNFQIGHIQLESSRYLEATQGERMVTRKILTFTQTLIQY